MKEIKDIIYIDTNYENSTIRYCGINFREFLKIVPNHLNNILLLTNEYWLGEYNSNISLYYLRDDQYTKFIKEYDYHYGNFCWIDFEDVKSLDLINPQEVAEILYLGHKQKPLNTLFFDNLKNNYAYCSHDDGWRTLLYCRYIADIAEFTVQTINLCLVQNIRGRKIYLIPVHIKDELFRLSCQGLFIDFKNIVIETKLISIPMYIIGNNLNMDDVYNNQDEHKEKAKIKGYLQQKNKVWSII